MFDYEDIFLEGYYDALCEMEDEYDDYEDAEDCYEDAYLEGYYDALNEDNIATGKDLKTATKIAHGVTRAGLGLSAGATAINAGKALKNHKDIKELESRKDKLSDFEKRELKKLKIKRFRNAAGTVAGGILTANAARYNKKAKNYVKSTKNLDDNKRYRYNFN